MHRNRLYSSILILALIAPLAACGGGGGGGSSVPATSSTGGTTASATPGPYTCPSSDTELATTSGGSSGTEATKRMYGKATSAASLPLLAVSYKLSSISSPATAIDARVASLGATKFGEYDYPKIGVATRLLHVATASMAQAESTLRSVPGVVAVSASHRMSALTVSAQYLGNDPYFVGYTGTTPPLYQTPSTGGQWDMHIVGLGDAFDYSQNSNGSGIVNAGALGSTDVKLAIIDTGEDVTQPELAKANIVRTECFITNEAGTAQSTGTYVTDGDGHGTDVTGIAVANPLNDYGFVGDGGNVSLMLYRVFPTPDDNCAPGDAAGDTDPQCGAADTDIASAIDDAVAKGANVISMSIGGTSSSSSNTGCPTAGMDFDTIEGDAVASAIASGVIVVAAAGNAGGEGIDAPACDNGVIAAGATGYYDGAPNGSGYAGTNSGVNGDTEYVTSYSQYGSPNTPNSTSSWGIVAPGGDPSNADVNSATTTDYLHWIENIWTSTPFMASSTDTTFEGNCAASTEYGEKGNCRTLIAGTSMATPHVAGAAALILSVNSSYASASAMRQLLCSTADNIGDAKQGCGRLNVYRAMAQALGDSNPPT